MRLLSSIAVSVFRVSINDASGLFDVLLFVFHAESTESPEHELGLLWRLLFSERSRRAQLDRLSLIGLLMEGSATGMSPSFFSPPTKWPLQIRSCCNKAKKLLCNWNSNAIIKFCIISNCKIHYKCFDQCPMYGRWLLRIVIYYELAIK